MQINLSPGDFAFQQPSDFRPVRPENSPRLSKTHSENGFGISLLHRPKWTPFLVKSIPFMPAILPPGSLEKGSVLGKAGSRAGTPGQLVRSSEKLKLGEERHFRRAIQLFRKIPHSGASPTALHRLRSLPQNRTARDKALPRFSPHGAGPKNRRTFPGGSRGSESHRADPARRLCLFTRCQETR